MQKRLIEIAVARTGAETEFTSAVFSGPVLRKRKNSAAKSEGTAHGSRPEKNQRAKGQCQRHAPCGDQVECAMVSAQPDLGEPAADEGSDNSIDYRDGANRQACRSHRHASRAAQKLRHPPCDAAHRKGQHGQAEGSGQESRIAEEPAELCFG